MRPSSGPLAPIEPALRPRLRSGFRILLQAFNDALEARRNAWDFGVRRPQLQAARLTKDDLRWLFDRGYVQHAVEKTKRGSRRRVFGKRGEILFHAKSCFVLTEAGLGAARVLVGETPFYDRKLRELWVREKPVKILKQPAPDQHTILSAFEESRWPPRIDDPLPPKHGGRPPKLRLRDAIHRLNGHQKPFSIRFGGDGTGKGIRWEFA